MLELDADNVVEYLRGRGYLGDAGPVAVDVLRGGVSNQVLLLQPAGSTAPLVVKQARRQLRTEDPWFCDPARIFREAEVLRHCAHLVPEGRTPRILFEDRESYLFGMTAAPAGHTTWKSELLAGRFDRPTATCCGELMAALHAGTWGETALAATLGDLAIFDALRLDPYYRTVARRHPSAAERLRRLIESAQTQRHALVHADFSPKNLLVFAGGPLLIDFETGHYGDPAFDLGFFLTHLVLKTGYHAARADEVLDLAEAFWAAYEPRVGRRAGADEYRRLMARGMLHLGGCIWARLDGKSPVEYLHDERLREALRRLADELLTGAAPDWHCARAAIRRYLAPLAVPRNQEHGR